MLYVYKAMIVFKPFVENLQLSFQIVFDRLIILALISNMLSLSYTLVLYFHKTI
jgi:hypothetical protein